MSAATEAAAAIVRSTSAETPAPRGRILIVDDNDNVRDTLTAMLSAHGYGVDTAPSGEDALHLLERELYDVVLLDLHLPGMSGIAVLSAAPAVQTDAQFVLMTGYGSIDSAIEAMKLGAFDYLTKPFRTPELLLTLERAERDAQLRREVAQLRRASGEGARARMVGKSAPMRRMYALIERVAPSHATVLIEGETGTGKELVARAIHELSGGARRPFVAVNCSALPETLLESELFGHMKGSFTGAIASRRGLFEEAAGGTLFLDEISAISQNIQVKLLRVLQEHQVQRVGGGPPIRVDFRLIAATNSDLRRAVEQGTFREDLFYRLNVFPVRVPPLRERRDDIPLLAHHFRLRFARENALEAPGLSDATLARMMDYDWPGNVRELENFIERGVIMYAGARTIPFEPTAARLPASERALVSTASAGRWDLARLEREYILEILESTGGHRGRTAAILGIDRRTLYRKLREFGVERRAGSRVHHDAGQGGERSAIARV